MIEYKIYFFFNQASCKTGPWFNTDKNPGGVGDEEYIAEIVAANPTTACNFPEKVNVRKVGTQTIAKVLTNQNMQSFNLDEVVDQARVSISVSGNIIEGFICKNSDQIGTTRCSDYELQLCCPRKIYSNISLNFIQPVIYLSVSDIYKDPLVLIMIDVIESDTFLIIFLFFNLTAAPENGTSIMLSCDAENFPSIYSKYYLDYNDSPSITSIVMNCTNNG